MSDGSASFRWGIWGTGDVARKFALGLQSVEGASLAWTLSRKQSRADAFAQRIGAPRGFSSLADAAQTGADAIYIATPSHVHADNAVAALEAGIPVLVEKPFASSPADAKRIADTARARTLFAMEAMWTRFQPAIDKAIELIADGAIGTPRLLRGENCIASADGSSLYDPRGGGALRQRGIYPLSLAALLLGFPEESSAMVRRGPSGIDEETAMQMRHPQGAISQIRASTTATAGNSLEIHGDAGSITFEGRIWRPSALLLRQYSPRKEGSGGGKLADLRETGLGQAAQRLLMPLMDYRGRRRIAVENRGNAYGYEAEEVMKRIAAGELESPRMTLSESIALVELMDRMLDEGSRK